MTTPQEGLKNTANYGEASLALPDFFALINRLPVELRFVLFVSLLLLLVSCAPEATRASGWGTPTPPPGDWQSAIILPEGYVIVTVTPASGTVSSTEPALQGGFIPQGDPMIRNLNQEVLPNLVEGPSSSYNWFPETQVVDDKLQIICASTCSHFYNGDQPLYALRLQSAILNGTGQLQATVMTLAKDFRLIDDVSLAIEPVGDDLYPNRFNLILVDSNSMGTLYQVRINSFGNQDIGSPGEFFDDFSKDYILITIPQN